jgi:hypothetical protein
MIRVFKLGSELLNIDNEIDVNNIIEQGAEEITDLSVFEGLESYVSPSTVTILDDGTFDISKLKKYASTSNIQAQIMELESYLRETDWYAVRYAETGEIPVDIKTARQAARDEISTLRAQLTPS